MKIIVADDHTLFREGLGHILVRLAPEVVLLEAENFEQAGQLLEEHPDADLALIDLGMPACKSISGLNDLLLLTQTIPIVVLSGSEDTDDIRHVLNTGAMGFIPKRENADVMLSALRLVLSGGVYVPPIMMTVSAVSTTQGSSSLTPRQLDVLRCMTDGYANKEIGRLLGLSEATVKAHVTAIFRGLNVSNRTQAIRAAENLGLLSHKTD